MSILKVNFIVVTYWSLSFQKAIAETTITAKYKDTDREIKLKKKKRTA